MGLSLIPDRLRKRFHFGERGHACAILAADFPAEFQDVTECLENFVLRRSHILTPGGGKSPISTGIDAFLRARGWAEKSFDIKILIDGVPTPTPTHKIDNFRNRVGLEVEWNNKMEFYDRDSRNS